MIYNITWQNIHDFCPPTRLVITLTASRSSAVNTYYIWAYYTENTSSNMVTEVQQYFDG